jgi:hypothetical protein
MSYDLRIQSDWWSSISVPAGRVLTLLDQLPGVHEIYPGTVDVPIGNSRTSVRLVMDEVDEQGRSLEILRRREAKESFISVTVPENCNLVSASIAYGFGAPEYRGFMDLLWKLADALGWRLFDLQEGRFVRPRYDTQVFLPPDIEVGEINRRMALALKAAGATRAAKSPATSADHGRIHGFWGDWSMTLRYCNAPFAAREAQERAAAHASTPPWDRVAASQSFVEFWGDHDENMDHFNDYISLCQGLESHFPGCVIVTANGEIV